MKQIEDVIALRHHQFPDGGALAHLSGRSYVAIDNFYTATVYEKGAEVIGMLKHLVGDIAMKRRLIFTLSDTMVKLRQSKIG